MSTEVFSYQVDSPFDEQMQFSTVVSESEGGKEQRYQKWLRPKRTFTIKLNARDLATASDGNSVWRMYQRMKGSFDTFFFENPNESPVTGEIIGSGDGIKSVFYTGNSVQIGTGDQILTPNTIAVTRSIKGTGDFLTFSAYSIAESLGQLTTTVPLPSGDVLKANYNFRYKCRFKEDNLTRETFAANLCNYGLDLIEVV